MDLHFSYELKRNCTKSKKKLFRHYVKEAVGLIWSPEEKAPGESGVQETWKTHPYWLKNLSN